MVKKATTIEVKDNAKNGAVIEPCNCVNEYQDFIYGKGRRVKNCRPSAKPRCTVCGISN